MTALWAVALYSVAAAAVTAAAFAVYRWRERRRDWMAEAQAQEDRYGDE